MIIYSLLCIGLAYIMALWKYAPQCHKTVETYHKNRGKHWVPQKQDATKQHWVPQKQGKHWVPQKQGKTLGATKTGETLGATKTGGNVPQNRGNTGCHKNRGKRATKTGEDTGCHKNRGNTKTGDTQKQGKHCMGATKTGEPRENVKTGYLATSMTSSETSLSL